MTELKTVENKLKEAFDLLADSLVAAGYPGRIQDGYELIDANESAIGLEIICSNLYEFECSIRVRAYDLFAEIGVYLEVNSSYWETLKPYIIG